MIKKLPPLDYRIPNWDHNDLLERYCPICNSTDADMKYIRPDSLNVRLCNNCNTFYISPAPSYHQLSSFYATYDESHRRAPSQATKNLIHTYQNVDPFADPRIREISSLMSIEGSKILDVGFGRAQLLYGFMKLGATTYGVELDEKAIEYAKAIGIQNIYQGTLDDVDDETKYDLIMMNDLAEHPLNPMDLFKRATDLLNEKGFLLIWTPNGDITKNEDNPTTFRVDLEHMQYLTSESCIHIARQLNLQVMHLESLGFPALNRIDKPTPKGQNIKTQIKETIKSIPGFVILNRLRKALMISKSKTNDERIGTYHLFCILQKID